MIISEMIAAQLDIISSIMCEFHQHIPGILNETVCTLYYVEYLVVIMCMYMHTISFFDFSELKDNHKKILYYVPAGLVMLVYLTNSATHYAYTITRKDGFIFEDGYPLSIYLTLFYIIHAIVRIVRSRSKLNFEQICALMSAWIIMLLGVIYEYVNPRLLITNLAITIAELVLYLIQQNPDLYRDRVSNLYNYQGFMEIANDLISRNEAFSCMCFEMRNYENMRTMYSGMTIEEIRSGIGEYLNSVIKRPNMIFYLSKGRFVAIYHDEERHEEEAAQIANRFNDAWEIPYGDNEKYYVRADVTGVYLPKQKWGTNYVYLRNIIYEAFLLFAKDEMNKIYLVDEDKMRRIERRYDVAQAIERALVERSIEVYYQPIYSYEKKKVISAEALARMYDDKLGFVPPDEFISVAENNGNIMELGYQIFEKVCMFIKKHDLDELGLDFIEINLSPVQFRNEKLAERLLEIIDKYQIDPSRLNFEITESAMMDIERTIRQIEPLRKRGISFSMDDYGTGYSNLIAVFQLPFSIIKIDKAIVWSHFKGENYLLEDFIQVFKKNDLKVVCEGVETEEMVNELNRMECDYQQGYFYSRPVEETLFLAYIKKINCKGISPH
ncbi:MAG: EAL domain-containing protein [Lachnospiraceae bacterium]|nr:EAL domain-containing protein [Lachnospiraceae bacterium]